MFLVNHLINLELGGGSKMENYTCLLHTVNNEFEFPKKEKKKLLPISYYFQSRFTSNNLQALNFGTQKED